jgi:hypothetical protein
MNTWKRTSNNSTQGGKKRLLLGGLVLGLVSLCNGMGHSKLLAPDLHPTQAGMGRRGNIFAQLTTRQLESGASMKLTQQDAATLTAAEAPTEAKSADLSGETEKAANIEEAVIAITKELNDPTSTSAPVTNSEVVIPPTVTEAATTPVENAAEEEYIDFSAVDNEVELVHEAAGTVPVEGANLVAPASDATIDEINNSAGDSLEL